MYGLQKSAGYWTVLKTVISVLLWQRNLSVLFRNFCLRCKYRVLAPSMCGSTSVLPGLCFIGMPTHGPTAHDRMRRPNPSCTDTLMRLRSFSAGAHIHRLGGEPDGVDADHCHRSRRKVAQAAALSVDQFTLTVPRGYWISTQMFHDATRRRS
jgi:hypothetical protein